MTRRETQLLDVRVLAHGDDGFVVKVAGELDLATAPMLAGTVERVRSENGFAALTIDLAELEFIDSTGLQCLLQIAGECEQSGLGFRTIGEQGQVRGLLALTGAAGALQVT
jgi:anti-anti-sigma factor